jgi:hypothetical protein
MIIENPIALVNYPVNIDGQNFIEQQLRRMKASAVLALVLSVSDGIIDTIAVHTDPATAKAALKALYQ